MDFFANKKDGGGCGGGGGGRDDDDEEDSRVELLRGRDRLDFKVNVCSLLFSFFKNLDMIMFFFPTHEHFFFRPVCIFLRRRTPVAMSPWSRTGCRRFRRTNDQRVR